MNFKQKFSYMFIGCLFTLAGYFFASLGGSPSPSETLHTHNTTQMKNTLRNSFVRKSPSLIKTEKRLSL